MTTKNPRINVTLDGETAYYLTLLAKKKKRSVASLARKFIEAGLEDYEDRMFAKMADKIDAKSTKTIPHDKFWAMVEQMAPAAHPQQLRAPARSPGQKQHKAEGTLAQPPL